MAHFSRIGSEIRTGNRQRATGNRQFPERINRQHSQDRLIAADIFLVGDASSPAFHCQLPVACCQLPVLLEHRINATEARHSLADSIGTTQHSVAAGIRSRFNARVNVELSAARPDEIAALFQFYVYDLSEMLGLDVEPDGRFLVRSLDNYWSDLRCHAFVIHAGGKIAGFALVQRPPSCSSVFAGAGKCARKSRTRPPPRSGAA
jgi:hypothetical protein